MKRTLSSMFKGRFALVTATSLSIAFVGCDVDVEDSGELPSVDVEPGRMPDVDVHGPDVEVGTSEKKIKVPDVDVDLEEKSVTVPTIDVDVPEEGDQ